MKGIRFERFGPASVMDLQSVEPPVCDENQVLIDIEAASVTPGDWKLRQGLLQHVFPVKLPCIPGRDGAGVISAIGSQVDYARVGDSVCFVADRTCQGSYAEQIVRDKESIAPMPAALTYAEAAALVHAGMCAWIMLVDYARVRAGQKVLVHAAAGAIGSIAVQLAQHWGAVVAATCSTRNVAFVRKLGAEIVVEYDKKDFSALLRDFDVVLDLVGGDVRQRSYRVLKDDGFLLHLDGGRPLAPSDSSPKSSIQTTLVQVKDNKKLLDEVVALAQAGVIQPQVSQIMPLSNAVEAHRLMETNQNSRGRIILDVRGRSLLRAHALPVAVQVRHFVF